MIEHQPYSILCLPVINAGKSTGGSDPEHKVSPGVFTPNRVEAIDQPSGQIPASIEQAELYPSFVERIRQRTVELERRNEFIYSFLLRYADDEVVTSLDATREGRKSDG